MTKRILIITDCADVAANELRATLVTNLEKHGDKTTIVEPVVTTKPFSVIQGDFLARLMIESYNPKNLTILSIINPLNPVAHKRARIAGRLKNGAFFVGPNTGVFTWLINDVGLKELCEVDNRGLKGSGFISFGGKYAHAPAAAKLTAKGKLASVKVSDFSEKDLVQVETTEGQVLHIDNFGVAKLRMKDPRVKPGEYLKLRINGKLTKHKIIYTKSMKELKDGTLALYPGSSFGLLEIGKVRTLDTAASLGLNIGDVVSFSQ